MKPSFHDHVQDWIASICADLRDSARPLDPALFVLEEQRPRLTITIPARRCSIP